MTDIASTISSSGTPMFKESSEAKRRFCSELLEAIDASGLVPKRTFKQSDDYGSSTLSGPEGASFAPQTANNNGHYGSRSDRSRYWVASVKVRVPGVYRAGDGYHATLRVKDGACRWQPALERIMEIVERSKQHRAAERSVEAQLRENTKVVVEALTAAGFKVNAIGSSIRLEDDTRLDVHTNGVCTMVTVKTSSEKAAELVRLVQEFEASCKKLGEPWSSAAAK